MSIMTVTRPRVKETRRTPRKPGRFGLGVTFYTPHYGRMPYTAAEYDAVARERAEDAAEWAELERRAEEAGWLARVEAGFVG